MSEVVLVSGYPASGKTTVTKRYTDQGYVRLNRDTMGGKVNDLNGHLATALKKGENVVMDNLYTTRESRSAVIKTAQQFSAPINVVLMGTSFQDAQFNACLRMMEKAGKILGPEDHKKSPYKEDPNLFPIAVLYKYKNDFEPPTIEEGFASVTTEKFVRNFPKEWVNKAVVFDFDDTLRRTDNPLGYPVKRSEVQAMKERAKRVEEYRNQGYLLLGCSNQSGVAKGNLTLQDAKDCFDETLSQMGLTFTEVKFCPHKVPPITCYCRKPNVGNLVEFVYNYKLDPRKCIFVGDQTSDKTCAERAGFKYVDQAKFFA